MRARLPATQGWRAVAGVRDVAAAEDAYAGTGVRVARLDVADAESVAEGVAAAERHAGGALACLVNNAAYGVLGAVEEGTSTRCGRMFETNLFGAAAVVQGVVPGMRGRRGRAVVFVSSIGARISNPLLGMYHASKYALSAIAEALAIEGRPFGIRVSTVEPGMVDTDFPQAVRPTGAAARGEGPYAPLRRTCAGFAAWRRDHPIGPRGGGRARSWRRPSTPTRRSGSPSATTRSCSRPCARAARRPRLPRRAAGLPRPRRPGTDRG